MASVFGTILLTDPVRHLTTVRVVQAVQAIQQIPVKLLQQLRTDGWGGGGGDAPGSYDNDGAGGHGGSAATRKTGSFDILTAPL